MSTKCQAFPDLEAERGKRRRNRRMNESDAEMETRKTANKASMKKSRK